MTRKPKHLIITMILLGALAFGATQALGAAGTSTGAGSAESSPPPANAPDPLASYEAPSGATLSDEAIRAAALRYSNAAGEEAPTAISAVDTTLASAVQTADPSTSLPTPTGGLARFEQSSVVLLVLQGQFTLDVSVPSGQTDPRGSVLMLALDAHTGRLDYRGVTNAVPSGLSTLGTVRALG